MAWGLLVIGLLLLGGGEPVAAIAHAFAEQNTNQTTAVAIYASISGATLASSSFTAGKKYLLVITAQMSKTEAGLVGFRVIHGSTAFTESEILYQAAIGGDRHTYGWMTVWTAVADEAVSLQFKVAASGTAHADQIALLAINLSDDLVENQDWWFAEDATDLALTTTFQNGASVTFSPSGTDDWLVLTFAQIEPAAITTSAIGRINITGGVTDTVPEARYETSTAAALLGFLLARVYTPAAVLTTVTEQSAESGADHSRLHSAVFGLNLTKFQTHAFAFTSTDLALSATDFATLVQTVSLTPAVAGDVWLGAYWGFDRNNASRVAEFRVQVDNADQPAGQTSDLYLFIAGTDLTDEDPVVLSTLPTLTAAAHTVDLDGSTDATTGAPAGQHRLLWAVTMELAVPPTAKTGIRTSPTQRLARAWRT